MRNNTEGGLTSRTVTLVVFKLGLGESSKASRYLVEP